MPNKLEGRRDNCVLFFFFFLSYQEIRLCWTMWSNKLKYKFHPSTPLVSSFPQSCEYSRLQQWERREQRAKATSDLRGLGVLKVKANHHFFNHSYSLQIQASWWKPGSSLKSQEDSLSQIKHLILLKSRCERCHCIVRSILEGILW